MRRRGPLLLALLLGTPAAFAARDCEAPLSLDARYLALAGTPSARERVAVTQLLNEAFSPRLIELAEILRARRPGYLRRDVRRRAPNVPVEEFAPAKIRLNESRREGYDRTYRGRFGDVSHRYVPFTDFNRPTMRRLWLAMNLVNRSSERFGRDVTRAVEFGGGDRRVIDERTWAKTDFALAFVLANESLAMAAAQLTSGPVAGLDADQLLRRVMSDQTESPSLMVRLALRLPPGVIGPNGNHVYVDRPLIAAGDALIFSPALESLFALRRPLRFRTYEFGHGCPVAHRRPDHRRPALQIYLDAVMHVIDSLTEL